MELYTPLFQCQFPTFAIYSNSVRYNRGKLNEGITGPFCSIFVASCEYHYFQITGSNQRMNYRQLHIEF